MSDNPAQIMEATEDFICEVNGERMLFHANESRVAASHPVVAVHPSRFRPVEENLAYTDEMATDNPGERRSRAVPRQRQAVAAAKED
jgi:hypothetical protein